MTNSSINYGLPDQLIGAGYIVSSVGILLIYLPCLRIIGFDAVISRRSCLRIMFHLGVSDVLSLIGNVILGCWTMTGYAYSVPYWLNLLVVSLTCELAYRAYVVLINILAFNRCVVFCFPSWKDTFFSERNTTLWLILSWLIAWGYTLLSLSGQSAMIYIASLFVWYYDTSSPWVKMKMKMDWMSCFVNQTCVIIWYLLIAREVKGQKNLTSVAAVLNTGRNFKSLFDQPHPRRPSEYEANTRSSERALLKQATILCIVLIASDQYWHNVVDFLCPRIGLYCYPLGNFTVILNNGCNPLVYMTLNKTISNKVLVSLGIKKENKVGISRSTRSRATGKRAGHTNF